MKPSSLTSPPMPGGLVAFVRTEYAETREDPMPDENLQGMLAEMDAQGAAERAVEGEGDPGEAKMAIQGALELLAPADTLEDRICRTAMRAVLGQDEPFYLDRPIPDGEGFREEHVFQTVALAWVGWAQGTLDRQTIHQEAVRLRAGREVQQGGAVHLMALFLWLDAVEHLSGNRREEAHRCWQRALEVGSSFGTESHPVILWTYIATFFPHEAPRARGRQARGCEITSAG